MAMCYLVAALFAVCTVFSGGVNGQTFAGCFTLAPPLKAAVDVEGIGWTNEVDLKGQTVGYCVAYCVQKYQKYAGVQATSNGKLSCYCGSENAFDRLGKPDHDQAQIDCHHEIWSMRTYVTSDDANSQYIGCYKEVTEVSNMASIANNWIDNWVMSPEECIRYCKLNGAAYANLRNGDTCTCGSSFAKHGQADESECNITCAGTKGQKCGGKLANAVFSALSKAEILNPGSLAITPGFALSGVVQTPVTQSLIQNLFDLQESIRRGIPDKRAKSMAYHLSRGQQRLQNIIDIKIQLSALVNSNGFSTSNAPDVRAVFSANFPPKLQPFTDVIQEAHLFVDRDVEKLMDFVKNVTQAAGPLKLSITEALETLSNYFDDDMLLNKIEKMSEVVQMAISASRNCLPLLRTQKQTMADNIETVSRALLDGPSGTRQYMENLKVFSKSAVTTLTAPNIDTRLWKESLDYIEQAWSNFIKQNGLSLYKLLQKTYSAPCAGAVATCRVSFLDMVNRSGANQAKTDMDVFVKANEISFQAMNWDTFTEKLDAIFKDFKSIEQYLVQAGISSPDAIEGQKKPIISFKFYQTCVNAISTMLFDVCHKTSKPDVSKVALIKC